LTNVLQNILAWFLGEKKESEEPVHQLVQEQSNPLGKLQDIEKMNEALDAFTMAEAAGLLMKEEVES